MKTKILLISALMGLATASAHAGIHFGFSIGLPVIVAPAPVVVAPAPVVVAPAPVVVAPAYAPVYAPAPGYVWYPGYWSVGVGGRAWIPGCWHYGHAHYEYRGWRR